DAPGGSLAGRAQHRRSGYRPLGSDLHRQRRLHRWPGQLGHQEQMVDWTQVLVASAVPTGAVLVAIIGLIPVLKKNQRSTEQAAHQAQEATKAANAATYAVTNGRPLPLRDDLDRNFNRVFAAIAKVDGKV